MLKTNLSADCQEGLKLLLLGAHCDDIEIGCGGTLLKLIEDYKISQVKWIVFTSNEIRKKEALLSANEFLGALNNCEVQVLDFKDGYLPYAWSKVKDEFEKLKEHFIPDVIFTHYRNDLHQDHRIINELTWNTFRNHLIFEYEITKFDGDLGNPNLFVPLEEKLKDRKTEILFKSFKSQLNKQWFDDVSISAIMRIRGIECVSKSGYAEAFYSRKITI